MVTLKLKYPLASWVPLINLTGAGVVKGGVPSVTLAPWPWAGSPVMVTWSNEVMAGENWPTQ